MCKPDNHRFEARYSTKDPAWPAWVAEAVQMGTQINASFAKDRIYECDVCVRCGATTRRTDHENLSNLRPSEGAAQ